MFTHRSYRGHSLIISVSVLLIVGGDLCDYEKLCVLTWVFSFGLSWFPDDRQSDQLLQLWWCLDLCASLPWFLLPCGKPRYLCPECLLSSLLLSLHGPESFNILWFSLCWVVCDYPTFHVPMFCVKFACLELLSVFPVLFWRAVSLVSVSRFASPCLVMSNQSQLSPSCLPFPDCPVCI